MNDQIIFSRLPKDYFMQSSEQLDLDAAVADIKKMREGFVSYMRDSHLSEELQNINDILQPSAFIARHFAEPNSDFLYHNELSEIPDPLPVVRSRVEISP